MLLRIAFVLFRLLLCSTLVVSAYLGLRHGPAHVNAEPSVWLAVFLGCFALFVADRMDENHHLKLGKVPFAVMSAALFLALASGAFAFAHYPCADAQRFVYRCCFCFSTLIYLRFDFVTWFSVDEPTTKPSN